MSSPLLDHLERGHIRSLVEELSGGELQHPVLFDDVEDAVPGEADAVRDFELDGRRENLDLVRNAVLIAVRHGVDVVLAGSDEHHPGIGAHSHVARIGNDRVELNLEPRWQLHLSEIAPQGVCLAPLLRDRLGFDRAGARKDESFSRLPVGD